MFSIISSDGVELNMEYMHPGIVLTSLSVGDNRGLSLVETYHVTYIHPGLSLVKCSCPHVGDNIRGSDI